MPLYKLISDGNCQPLSGKCPHSLSTYFSWLAPYPQHPPSQNLLPPGFFSISHNMKQIACTPFPQGNAAASKTSHEHNSMGQCSHHQPHATSGEQHELQELLANTVSQNAQENPNRIYMRSWKFLKTNFKFKIKIRFSFHTPSTWMLNLPLFI